MFGFFVAALSAVGLVYLARRRRHHSPLGWALRGLNASPAQEKIFREAQNEAKAAFRELREDARTSRAELAEVLREESFDESRVEAWLRARSESFDRIKPRLLAAIKDVHQSLDGEQRSKISRFVERGGMGYGGHRHHHHHHHASGC